MRCCCCWRLYSRIGKSENGKNYLLDTAASMREMDNYMMWVENTFAHKRIGGDGELYPEVVSEFRSKASQEARMKLLDLFVLSETERFKETGVSTFLEAMLSLQDRPPPLGDAEMHESIRRLIRERPNDTMGTGGKSFKEVLLAFLGDVPKGSVLYERAAIRFRNIRKRGGDEGELAGEVAWLLGFNDENRRFF